MLQSVVQPLVRRVTDKGSKTLIQRAIASLRARGTDAHLWLPGGDVRTYGPELVVNGDFGNGATGWALPGTAAVASGVVTCTNTPSGEKIFNNALSTLTEGKTYQATYTCTSYTSGTFGWSHTNYAFTGKSAAGTYVETFVCVGVPTNGNTGIRSGGSLTASFDNISVREITSITSALTNGLTTGNYLESTGNSLATVDNPTGLVLDALGTVGVELVTSVAWETPAGVSETGGVVTFASPSGYVGAYQAVNAVVGKTYQVSYRIASYTSGSIKAICGGNGNVVRLAAGTYSELITAGDTTAIAYLQVQGSFVGVIDRYSVREVTGIHLTQGTTANKGLLKQDAGSRYYWLFDATDLLTGTFPAGYESVTVIDAKSTGQVTTSAANVVGSYSIGPSYSSYGRIIIKGSITASELALYQGFANRLAGL